jgi:hypothetical protein
VITDCCLDTSLIPPTSKADVESDFTNSSAWLSEPEICYLQLIKLIEISYHHEMDSSALGMIIRAPAQ